MSYFLRAGLIRRIAESGPTVTFTRTIKEWDGTISTVTVRSQMGGDYVITYPNSINHTVTKAYLDSITVKLNDIEEGE